MPISLRCNVFQLISSAGELRPSLTDIAKRFADAQNGLQYLLDGQIDLAVATGPEAVIVTYKDPVPPDGEKVVCQAVQRAPKFAELRALPGFGAIHVCFVTAFTPSRSEGDGKLACTEGYGEYPFILAAEGADLALARMVLVHEFGHLLLGPRHFPGDGNLMSDGSHYATLTPDQKKRMLDNATRIASGHRPHYGLFE